MFKRILFFGVTLLMFVASITAASACTIGGYQPEIPESLK